MSTTNDFIDGRPVPGGHRPSLLLPKPPKKRARPTGETELRRRFANGLDLWTGLPLAGRDAESWVRLRYGKEEVEPRSAVA